MIKPKLIHKTLKIFFQIYSVSRISSVGRTISWQSCFLDCFWFDCLVIRLRRESCLRNLIGHPIFSVFIAITDFLLKFCLFFCLVIRSCLVAGGGTTDAYTSPQRGLQSSPKWRMKPIYIHPASISGKHLITMFENAQLDWHLMFSPPQVRAPPLHWE